MGSEFNYSDISRCSNHKLDPWNLTTLFSSNQMGPGPPEFQRTFPLRKPIAGDDRQVSLNFLFIFSCLAFLCIFFFLLFTFLSFSSFFSFSIFFFGHHLSWSFSWNCTLHVCTAKIQYRQFKTNIHWTATVPVPTFMFLWAIYIFLGSVCLFCYRKIGGPNMGSLTDTWI